MSQSESGRSVPRAREPKSVTEDPTGKIVLARLLISEIMDSLRMKIKMILKFTVYGLNLKGCWPFQRQS